MRYRPRRSLLSSVARGRLAICLRLATVALVVLLPVLLPNPAVQANRMASSDALAVWVPTDSMILPRAY